jgi:hypothetical protein
MYGVYNFCASEKSVQYSIPFREFNYYIFILINAYTTRKKGSATYAQNLKYCNIICPLFAIFFTLIKR